MSGEPLGEREIRMRVIYNDKADMLSKLQEVIDGLKDGSDSVVDHPIWVEMSFNCCGGSPP